MVAAPPPMRVQRAPNVSPTQPTMGEPSGVPPMRTIMYSAITRPRMAGATLIWKVAFAEVIMVSDAMPMTGVQTAKETYDGRSPATISATPNATAARITSRCRIRPRRAASSAPDSEPIASVVPRRPYSPAGGARRAAGRGADRERGPEEAVLAGALVEDLGGHERGRELEVEPE